MLAFALGHVGQQSWTYQLSPELLHCCSWLLPNCSELLLVVSELLMGCCLIMADARVQCPILEIGRLYNLPEMAVMAYLRLDKCCQKMLQSSCLTVNDDCSSLELRNAVDEILL